MFSSQRHALSLLVAMSAVPLACGRPADPAPSNDEGDEHRGAPGAVDESAPQREPPAHDPASGPTRARTVYVPAYSHLGSPTGRMTLLAITLSVRNVDPSSTITLTHVDYFDTSGHRVRRYLRAPRPLRPLETAEFFVDRRDEVGGSGANFLVNWEGPSTAHALLTETVMVGHAGEGYLSFTSRGVELEREPNVEPTGEPEPTEAAGDSSGAP